LTTQDYLDGARIKIVNSPHNSIPPIAFIPTIENKKDSLEASKKLQETNTHCICIRYMLFDIYVYIYIYISYTRSGIAFAVRKLAKFNSQPGDPHLKSLVYD
jgi:hypothetical protein